MSKQIIDYTKEFMPSERDDCAQGAWSEYQAGNADIAKNLIGDFYAAAERGAAEDLRAFDIEALAEDYDAIVVSAIRTYGNLGPFRPENREDFKGIRLFDILLRPNQIICCSTVMPGDSSANLYGNWGVIVGKGNVLQAFPYDATTSVNHGEIESKFTPRLTGMRPTEQIQQAIQARHIYNEINANVNGIAGIFYGVDEGRPLPTDLPSKVFRDIIEPYAIPQYLLRGGQFYPIDQVEDIELGLYGDAMPAADIVQRTVYPSGDQQDEMIHYLTGHLTLAPRNAITSGVARGQFAYDFRHTASPGSIENFYREQNKLLSEENISLRLYGAMALHAFAEVALGHDDVINSERAQRMADDILHLATYQEYKARILPSGNLTVTEADLRHYLATTDLPGYLKDH